MRPSSLWQMRRYTHMKAKVAATIMQNMVMSFLTYVFPPALACPMEFSSKSIDSSSSGPVGESELSDLVCGAGAGVGGCEGRPGPLPQGVHCTV